MASAVSSSQVNLCLVSLVNLTSGRDWVASPCLVSSCTADGQFPGPTVRVKKGDQVQLKVTNELSSLEGLSLHVHGMHQKCVRPTRLS